MKASGGIRAKKKQSGNFARARTLGKAFALTPETSDGLRRSPRISRLLDGHKTKLSSFARPPKGPSKLSKSSLQDSPEGNVLSLFPGPVKFPSLTDLEKLSSTYPQISTVALQEKASQCGVPPEEVTLQLLHSQRTPAGQEGSSRQHKLMEYPMFSCSSSSDSFWRQIWYVLMFCNSSRARPRWRPRKGAAMAAKICGKKLRWD
jgi:hypothetical protein